MLMVKKLDPRAIVPTVANPGEDLGYDLYALEDTGLIPGRVVKVRTGISAVWKPGIFEIGHGGTQKYGLLIRDRSSMAARGITNSGGAIDAGYRGEIVVLLTLNPTNYAEEAMSLSAGDKIAQMLPQPVLTAGGAFEVSELPPSARGEKGFGSTGK